MRAPAARPGGECEQQRRAEGRAGERGAAVSLLTMRFHCFFFRFPDLITLKTSSSDTGATCGRT